MDVYSLTDQQRRYQSLGYPERQTRRKQHLYSPSLKAHRPTIQRSPSQLMSTRVMEVPQEMHMNDINQENLILDSDVPLALREINESKLADIVRNALQREKFHIQGWRVNRLDIGAGNPVSLGLFRFEGTGVDQNEWLDWSVILKVIQSPANLGYTNFGEGDDQAHWNYWKRELMVYRSGWLETLPEGLNAPRCYEVNEMPGNIASLWLEDINDSYPDGWPLHRYALTARHLGRLNGVYISRRGLPTYPWLSQHRIRQWLDMISWQDIPWNHPRVLRQYPLGEQNSFRRMLQDHERFLSKLDQLPKTLTHGDTYPTNFKSRRMYRGQEQTVALDWALTGIEPIGDDLGQLVYGTWMNLKGYKLQDISQILFASYMNGLQDKSCQVDPELVRFGYTASAAFRVGLFKLVMLMKELEKESNLPTHFVSPPAGVDTFDTIMAQEATRLLDKL